LEENLRDLVVRMKAKQYRSQLMKRVYIPKPKGGEETTGDAHG